MQTRFRATVAYDGSAYLGFQRQRDGIPTIQGALEAALAQVTRTSVTVIGAGRTDTGVHATGQVILFEADWKHAHQSLLRAVNMALPEDIAVQTLAEAPSDFHPRFSALSRTYHYCVIQSDHRQPLLRHRAWQVWRTLDPDAMQTAAAMLIGRHDFAAFGQAPDGDNTVREVFRSHWTVQDRPYGRVLWYEIEATAFLKHMVRRITGLLVAVGEGRYTPQAFGEILASRDLFQAKITAPPHGLVLSWVRYPGDRPQPTEITGATQIAPCFIEERSL